MKWYYIFFIIVLMLPLVSASSLIYRKNTDIPIIIPCFDADNNYCDLSYGCNVTIVAPNNQVLVNNAAMTYNSAFFNYTFSKSLNTLSGQYMVSSVCTNTTFSGYSIFYFESNESGLFSNDWTFILAVGIIIFLFLFAASLVNAEQHPVLQIMLFVCAFLNAIIIPAFFMISNSKILFYKLFMFFLVIFGGYLLIYGGYWALCKLELIVPKERRY